MIFSFLNNTNDCTLGTEALINNKQINLIKEFNDKLNKFKYISPNNNPNYKIMSPKDFYKNKGGCCWDYTVVEAKFFKDNKIPFKTIFTAVSNYPLNKNNINKNDFNMITHTYCVIDNNIWFESAYGKHQGLTKVKNIYEPAEIHKKECGIKDPYSKFKIYDPLKTIGLTPDQFLSKMGVFK